MAKLNRTQTILRNIVSNWLGYVVQAAVVFFLTPYVLRELGDARYGVWALITSVTGTYGLLAFGLQGGVNQYLTRYFASRDYQKMNEVASTATAVLSMIGVAIVLVSVLVAAIFPYLFDVPEDLTREVRQSAVVVGASVAMQMGLFAFSSVFMATQRYDLSNAIGVVTRLLSAGLIVVALKFEYGFVGISVATLLANAMDYLVRVVVAYRIVPELRVRPSFVSKSAFWEMCNFGLWSFVGTLAQSMGANSGAIVIGAMLPITAMAPYSLALGLVRQLDSLLGPLVMVFFPAMTELHARGELETIRRVYLTSSRLFLVVVAGAGVVSGVFADDFFRLWVGEQYISGSAYPSVADLYRLMLVAAVCRLLPGIGSQVLLGTLKVKELSMTYLAEAIVSLGLSIALISGYGLTGVSVAMIVAAVTCRMFVVPFLVGRQLNLAMTYFAYRVWLRPLSLAIVLMLVVQTLKGLSAAPNNFIQLGTLGAIASLLASPCVIFIGMTSADRSRYLYQPLRSLIAGGGRIATDELARDANSSSDSFTSHR